MEQRLVLRHAFKLARSTSVERTSFIVRVVDEGGRVGLGEATPLHYLGETPEDLRRGLAALSAKLRAAPEEVGGRLRDAEARWRTERDRVARSDGLPIAPLADLHAWMRDSAPGERAARCALDTAFHDLLGARVGVRICELLNVEPSAAPGTTFTVAIASVPKMAARAQAALAAGHRTLKIKVGASDGPPAAEIAAAIRGFHSGPLILDANGGWDVVSARREIAALESARPTFVEQPILRGTPEALGRLAAGTSVPIFADEDLLDRADLERLPPGLGGINVKLMKAGGLSEAVYLIRAARARGWQVMLGCMIESSVGITAAAHLAGAVDFTDLDGALLLAEDPARGAVIGGGGIELPSRPGLGAELRASH